jgi:pimeloyl-ACP methyl ester carboxylesterase
MLHRTVLAMVGYVTIQHRTVAANGLEFGILEEGSGPLALCLHGFPDTARTWRHLLPELAATGYHAVAPFLRGYAPTSIPEDGAYQAGALAADANALHAALGGDGDAVLVGHDWGAFAAYGAGSLAPERWRRIVAMSVPPPAATARAMTSYDQVKRSFYIFMFQSPRAETIVGGNGMAFFDRLWQDWAPGYDAAEDVSAVKESLADPDRLGAAIGYYRAMVNPASHLPRYSQEQEALGKITPQPVLYLHGEDDGSLRVDSAETVAAQLSSASRVELIPGVGHFPHLEQPAKVNEKILSWLGGKDGD